MSNSARAHLLYAYRRVLRPLIRILIRSGVRYDEFLEIVRGVYVESAIRDGIGNEGKPTRAKISLSTGVPRRDVDRFIDNDGALPIAPTTLTAILSAVLNRWHTDPLYVGPYGIPLELEAKGHRSRSFSELVATVDARVNASDVLDELVRLKAVSWSGETHVRVTSRAFIPVEEMSPAQIEFFGNSLTRLAGTLQFNMDASNTAKRLERSVIANNGLPQEIIPIFQKHAREKVSELLVELDDWISPYAEHVEPGGSAQRVGVAVYQFVDPSPEKTRLADHVAPEG